MAVLKLMTSGSTLCCCIRSSRLKLCFHWPLFWNEAMTELKVTKSGNRETFESSIVCNKSIASFQWPPRWQELIAALKLMILGTSLFFGIAWQLFEFSITIFWYFLTLQPRIDSEQAPNAHSSGMNSWWHYSWPHLLAQRPRSSVGRSQGPVAICQLSRRSWSLH